MEDLARARNVLELLQKTLRTWGDVETIRARLPRRFARQIPRSRLAVVQRIAGDLARRGAIRMQSGDLEAIQAGAVVVVGAVALVATAAAVAVVVAVAPKVLREWRTAQQARQIARAMDNAAKLEERQARELGPEKAREMAAQRAEERRKERKEAAAAGTPPPPPLPPPDGAGELPWWTLPAALGVGALALFGWQKRAAIAPYIPGRRRAA